MLKRTRILEFMEGCNFRRCKSAACSDCRGPGGLQFEVLKLKCARNVSLESVFNFAACADWEFTAGGNFAPAELQRARTGFVVPFNLARFTELGNFAKLPGARIAPVPGARTGTLLVQSAGRADWHSAGAELPGARIGSGSSSTLRSSQGTATLRSSRGTATLRRSRSSATSRGSRSSAANPSSKYIAL